MSLFFLTLTAVFFISCNEERRTWVKNYPRHQAFVYSNKVQLTGNISKDEKKRMLNDLNNYWDDSMKVLKLQKFGFFYDLMHPPVLDTNNLLRSKRFMTNYLNTQGYYYPILKGKVTKIISHKDQQRAYISMNIELGKHILIDSIGVQMQDSVIQHIIQRSMGSSYLKQGGIYTKQLINNELDRIVGLLKQNGYFKFGRDHIYALIDTMDASILPLTLDPFQQVKLLLKSNLGKRDNLKWDVNIQQRPIKDSSVLKQYVVGNMYYYPDAKDIYDSIGVVKGKKAIVKKNYSIIYNKFRFNDRPLVEHTYLRKDSLYNETFYYKSINALGQIGAWKQVDARPIIRNSDTIDFHFFLVPDLKQNYTLNVEGSRNTGDISSGNLLGLSTNISYLNRNVWKQAAQSVTALRTGIEFSLVDTARSVQTFQIGLSHSYSFPRLIQPFRYWKALNSVENKQTLFTISGSYTDRFQIYRLRSLVSNWGYQWKKGDNTWQYKPLNIELYALDKLPGLDTLILKNPFLQLSFNTGNVSSQTLTFVRTTTNAIRGNRSRYYRFGIEECGFFTGLIPNIQNNIYRFIKAEVEFRQNTKIDKTALAYRIYGGAGYNYNNSSELGQVLPFFKQFYAGGPNSMRAWGLRQLGLGSSLLSDTTSSSFKDRYGDVQLEANVEYRFPIFNFGSFNIGSALFADVGNVWNIKRDATNQNAEINFGRFGRDLAIGVGTGLRFDFSYFLLRIDLAYKMKDPARTYNNGWLDIPNAKLKETRTNGTEARNYAFQLGIGLPF